VKDFQEKIAVIDNNASGIGYSVVKKNDPAPLLQGI